MRLWLAGVLYLTGKRPPCDSKSKNQRKLLTGAVLLYQCLLLLLCVLPQLHSHSPKAAAVLRGKG